jgi:hypothetical protein
LNDNEEEPPEEKSIKIEIKQKPKNKKCYLYLSSEIKDIHGIKLKEEVKKAF